MFRGFKHAAFNRAYQQYARHMDGWGRRPKYNVPLNIADKGTHFEVSIYATGFDKENIKLKVAGNELYVTGTRTINENEEPQFVKQEFPVKHFERVISLGEGIEKDGISARQENNILYITLPKNASAQEPARDIQVD